MPVNKLTPKNPTEFPERKLSLVTQKDYNLSRQKGLLLFVHLNPRELSFALMTATKLEIEANNESHSTEITYFTVCIPSRFQDERCQNRVCFAHYIAY